MFFRKKKSIKFKDVDMIVLERDGNHLELNAKTQIVMYRNVMSPRDGGKKFPDGYFDEKTAVISSEHIHQIGDAFNRLFLKRYPEEKLDMLPPGANRDAYMKIQSKGKVLYYTNTHISKKKKRLWTETQPVAEEYTFILKLLMKYCDFPEITSVGIPSDRYSEEVLEHLDQDMEADGICKVIGYRYDTTGVVGYDFYKGTEKLANISCTVAPLFPVMIEGFGMKWSSYFDPNHTIMPGEKRSIQDAATGQMVYEIAYLDAGKYEMNDLGIVYCDTRRYAFFFHDKLVAKIKRTERNTELTSILTQYESTPYYEISIDSGISKELWMLVFLFPQVQFGF